MKTFTHFVVQRYTQLKRFVMTVNSRKVIPIALSLMALTFIFACTKKNDVTASQGGSGNMSFKVDGVLVSTNAWNASYLFFGATPVSNITSNMHIDKRTINININSHKKGTFPLNSGNLNVANKAYGSYKPDFDDALNSFSFKTGNIIVSAIDTVAGTFNATFEGTATNSSTGTTVNITEGQVTNATLVKAY